MARAWAALCIPAVEVEEKTEYLTPKTAEELLILGHMPFIGVSYQSKEKDKQYRKKFAAIGETRRVLHQALRMGVRKFAAAAPTSSSLSHLHLQALKLLIEDGHRIKILPCIGVPLKLGAKGVDACRRWATYAKLEARDHPNAKQRMISDPILNFRSNWQHKFPVSKPYRKKDFQKVTIDFTSVEQNLKLFANLCADSVEFGSEVDFLTMTGRLDLIARLLERAREHGFRKILVGVHHAGITIRKLDSQLSEFHGYVTPLNSLGIMMFPTKQSAELSVKNARKAVYAIKPLGGGRIEPKPAFTYVFRFNIEGCMIGASSTSEVRTDVSAAVKALQTKDR
ncbi:MAG: hypothetical protein NWE81_03175 [Candidatus Bathyarchaeota archaeon]|jgi:hypothetical protein|nr:hypothetical protein [Candidatus Bathyarchaeota archaeon]